MGTAFQNRRQFLKTAVVTGSGILATGPGVSSAVASKEEKEVAANEDLMREHGVLRRALLVYRNVADRLRHDPANVPANALSSTARLFRTFGEDYHERQLEEQYIFPTVRKLNGPAARYPDVLKIQHDRGRMLTDYVLRVTQHGNIAGNNAMRLAQALSAFALMYEHHTAREDTIVFTAWKAALSDKAYKEMGEQFETIEKKMFGHDGFEEAVRQMAAIEAELGIADIAQFTIAPVS